MKSKHTYDVFVSHASENKIEYVDEFVNELKNVGLSVFYDTDVISWGDNFRSVIENAIQDCEFAIIVFSKEFIGKEWTEIELKSFIERQNEEGQKIILPILYNISKDEFIEQYPSFKDVLFKHAKSYTKKDLANAAKKELDKRFDLTIHKRNE